MKWDIISEMDVSSEFSMVWQLVILGQDTYLKPIQW